ncbi:uncharacterized protein ACMZJ9_000107 [Mantella aurantiaca]
MCPESDAEKELVLLLARMSHDPIEECRVFAHYGLSRRENNLIYHLDEGDSGCLSYSSSSGYFEDELKTKFAQSERRRSALHQSLRNACDALQHQNVCLKQQENDKANSDVTLEHLLLKQELLESRFSYLKHSNISPEYVSREIIGTKGHSCFHYSPVITDSNSSSSHILEAPQGHCDKILNLEKDINDIKMKMRRYSLLKENNIYRRNLFEERKEEAQYEQMQEELRQHAELVEDNCSKAQRERDALELEITSLYSGLHQAKVASKELEKECVKLQSQVEANRNINENLHLEMSALKNHRHTLENAAKASVSENKSLHSQIENLQQENQSLFSQKELLCSIMKKKGKKKPHHEERSKRAARENQIHKHEDNSCVNPKDSSLLSVSSFDSSLRSSRRSQKLRRNKGAKCESKDDSSKLGDELQMDCERPEMNTEIILACYQHLADLLRKLECLLKSNVSLDKDKEQIFKFLLGMIKEIKDGNISSNRSREHVEELLNERNDLRENYHMKLNQITAVIIELKHLRQAYNGILKNSENPNDRHAMVWLSRVQAIKESLKLLKQATNFM